MKKVYSTPEITVVTFKVELGLGESQNQTSSTLGTLNYDKSSKWDNVNTGDRMSEMTSSDGENTCGGWL